MPPPHRPRRPPPIRTTMHTISALPNLVSLNPPPTPNELKALRCAFFDLPIENSPPQAHRELRALTTATTHSTCHSLLGTTGHGLTNVEMRYTLSCIYKSSLTLQDFRGFVSPSTRPLRNRILRLFQFPARRTGPDPSIRRRFPRYEDSVDTVHRSDRRGQSATGLDQQARIDLSH